MTATVKYSNDVIMSYSLNAYMPIEGYSLCLQRRRRTRGDPRLSPGSRSRSPSEMEVYVIKAFGTRTKIDVPTVEGEHGGADDALREPDLPAARRWPTTCAFPDSRAGAMSALTGIAARRSCEENRPITISDLVTF